MSPTRHRWPCTVPRAVGLLGALLLASCAGDSSPSALPTRDVMSSEGYSGVRWGATVTDVERRFGAVKDCRGTEVIGCPCPVFHPALPARLVFGPDGLHQVDSGPRTVTPGGVHKGSTVADVRAAYPGAHWVLGAGRSDVGLADHLLVEDGGSALAFIIDKQRVVDMVAVPHARRLGGEACA